MRPETQAEALEIIKDLVSQFAYPIQYKRKPALSAGGLSALGAAFDFLGWSDPHPCPENACEIKGCNEWATCGTSTPTEGYKRVCGNHFRKIQGESKDAENQ